MRWATRILNSAQVDSPSLSAQLILAYVIDCERLDLITYPHRKLSPREGELYREYIKNREYGLPVAYITGQKEFYGLDFQVNEDVLIPRPETEGIIDATRRMLPSSGESFRFADLGTGSGALGVVLAFLYPCCSGIGTDISLSALRVARENARKHGVAERLSFVACPTGNGLAGNSFDLVVSNPPYISTPEFASLDREVSGFEPKEALLAGEGGLQFYPALARDGERILRKGGIILMEIGANQGEEVLSLFGFWDEVSLLRDLAGRDRYVYARRR